MTRKRLGELLVEGGIITSTELDKALRLQDRTRVRLGQALLSMGVIDEERLAWALATQIDAPLLNLNNIFIDPKVLRIIPRERCTVLKVLPISVMEDSLTVATSDPFDVMALDEVKMLAGMPVRPVVATETAIMKAIEKYYDDEVGLDEVVMRVLPSGGIEVASVADVDLDQEGEQGEGPLHEMALDGQSQPVIRLINSIIRDAIRMRSSDIHLEPMETSCVVRYRIDGLMRNIVTLPLFFHPRSVCRIKVMGRMDISERRMPQDGRSRVRVRGNEMDLRISTIPSQHGENVVIRILNRQESQMRLDRMGLLPDAHQQLESMLRLKQGIILLTGPTGSGKTTTLYAMLHQLKTESSNIVTLEDPIEYNIPGIIQSQTHEKSGFTFASGLRALLRQDPDVIMVGEIRDSETANIAFNAAMTGHLVLSTLHTNDSTSVPIRLAELGVSPFLITAGLRGIIAQRLVRRICTHCREPVRPDADVRRTLGLNPQEPVTLYRSVGCKVCAGSGFYGRMGIYEILVPSEQLNELIFQNASGARLFEQAQRDGMRSLSEDAALRVIQGVTTLEEVGRVVTMEPRRGVCPRCQQPVERYRSDCPSCHFSLNKTLCGTCGRDMEEDWSFCPYCATATAAEFVPAAAPPVMRSGAEEPVVEEEAAPAPQRCDSCGMILKPTWTDCPLCLKVRVLVQDSDVHGPESSPRPLRGTPSASPEAAPVPAEPRLPPSGSSTRPRPAPGRPYLLVVTEDSGMLMEARGAAQEAGFDVVGATCPEEALRRVNGALPAAVVLDALLSDTDGIALCRKLRQHPRMREVPIGVVVGPDSPEDETRAVSAGASELLRRPLRPADLAGWSPREAMELIAQTH